jgi:hypothetical protein
VPVVDGRRCPGESKRRIHRRLSRPDRILYGENDVVREFAELSNESEVLRAFIVSEAQEVALELDRAVPGLEGKCRTPHEPEVCLEERRVELVRNAASSEHSLRLKLQALDGQDMLFAQPKLGSVDPFRFFKDYDLVTGEASVARGTVTLIMETPRSSSGAEVTTFVTSVEKGGSRERPRRCCQILAATASLSPIQPAPLRKGPPPVKGSPRSPG